MTNPHGTPIWYELVTPDPVAAKSFYDAVVGWTIGPRLAGETDYRTIACASGDNAGGVLRLTPEMLAGGARQSWLFYIGVDDVDATVAAITARGGDVRMPAFDMPDVGRLALVTDPQGNAFYVMRGASEENSIAFGREALGHCSWNELITSDAVAGNAFYAEVFGWTYPRKMTMPGEMGDYTFIDCAGQELGATMKAQPGQPTGWTFYFRVADIDDAAQTVTARGGTVHMGPMEVPGGERVIMASDPAGAPVGFVAGQGAPA